MRPRTGQNKQMIIRIVLPLLLVLGGVACDQEGEPEAGPSPTPEVGETLDDAPRPTGCEDLSAADAGAALVVMEDNRFTPPCLAVSSTQGIQLANDGANLHNFSIGDDVDVDVEPGGRQELEPLEDLTGPGTFDFVCKYHEDAGMIGVVIVE